MLAPTLLLTLTTLATPLANVDARYVVYLKERAPNAIVEQVIQTQGDITYDLWLDIQQQVQQNLQAMKPQDQQ